MARGRLRANSKFGRTAVDRANLEAMLPLHTLRNLKTLEISIEGDLPLSWGGLTKLTRLDLPYMEYIPDTLLAITNLQELSVSTDATRNALLHLATACSEFLPCLTSLKFQAHVGRFAPRNTCKELTEQESHLKEQCQELTKL